MHNRLQAPSGAKPCRASESGCRPNVKPSCTGPPAMIRGWMNATALSPTGASPALAAFLRGIGRRALLFAQLQAGDPARGDAAAMAALPGFAATAAGLPMAQWPRRFWAGLLAESGLRPAPGATWPPPFERLSAPGPGARAALLLWLVAGLGEDDAAAALGVGVPAWRLALQRAAPHDPAGELDTTAWRALETEVRETLRALPAERLQAWERACEEVAPATPPIAVAAAARAAPPRPRGRRWLWPALGLCVIALAATYLWPWPWPLRDAAESAPGNTGAPALVERKPLSGRDVPRAFDAGDEAALLLHPDFELLAGGGDTPLLRDLAFQSWYARQRVQDAVPSGDADAR